MKATRLATLLQTRGAQVADGVRDVDELVEITAPATRPHRIRPLTRDAALDAHVETVTSVHMALTHMTYGADVTVIPGEVDPETFLFPLSLAGRGRLTYGNDVLVIAGDAATMIAPYRPFQSEIRADYDQIIVAVRSSLVETVAGRLLGDGAGTPLDLPLGTFHPSAPVVALLETTALFATDQTGSVSSGVLAKLEEAVVESILISMPTIETAVPRPSAVPSKRLKDAMSYMIAHLSEPLTVGDVASRVGVTSRSLQLAFQRELGETPMSWLRALHFFVFGMLNSLQFVSMNTLTLKDLPQQDASSGNSFLSMIMMVSMSIGVALAGTLVNVFTAYWGTDHIVMAFHNTLIVLGCINLITAAIFWHIPKDTVDE